MRKNSKILVFAKLKDTQYAEAGCYYKKKGTMENSSISKNVALNKPNVYLLKPYG